MQRNTSSTSMFGGETSDHLPQGEASESIADKIFGWRNRLLANPDFHRKARRNPFMRFMARRRARALFDLVSGFVYSQILSTCVQLNLFNLLQSGPMSRDAISLAIGLDREASDVLLRSATSLKLLENRGRDRYGLGIHGAALLANPGVCKMIDHHTFLYRDLTDPVALLKREQDETMLSMFWDYAGARQQQSGDGLGTEPYTDLMSASQTMVAEQIIDTYPLHNHQCLLDVGGGDGTFLRTVARAEPDLALMLFDLPPVAKQAQARFSESNIGNEVSCHGGSVFDTALPKGADVISLVRIVHDHNDDAALAILKRCREALPAGGTLLLAEPMGREKVGDPATDAYFGMYLHAMGRGRPRTAQELQELISQAGFSRCSSMRTHMPMLCSLLVAKA
ncbi:MAG: methyltransferase [Granulosicoccus sp.]